MTQNELKLRVFAYFIFRWNWEKKLDISHIIVPYASLAPVCGCVSITQQKNVI